MPSIEIPRDVPLTISGFFAAFAPSVTIDEQSTPGLRIMVGVYDRYQGPGFTIYGQSWGPTHALKVLDASLGAPAGARAQLYVEAGQTAPAEPVAGEGTAGEPAVAAPDTGPALSFAAERFRDQPLLYRHEGDPVNEVQLHKDGRYCLARVPHAAAGVEGAAPAAGAMYDLLFAVPREGTRVTPLLLHRARVADAASPFHHFCFFHAADGHPGPERIKLVPATRR